MEFIVTALLVAITIGVYLGVLFLFLIYLNTNNIMLTNSQVLERLNAATADLVTIKESAVVHTGHLENITKDVAFLKRKFDEQGITDPEILAAFERLGLESTAAVASNQAVIDIAKTIADSTEDEVIEPPVEPTSKKK